MRSKQDQRAVEILGKGTVRVNVDGTNRYATPLLRVHDMPILQAPYEAVLWQLKSTERRLGKLPEQAAAYRAEKNRLVTLGYVVKLEPGAENTPTNWYMPHHMVHHNGKNRVCSTVHLHMKGTT